MTLLKVLFFLLSLTPQFPKTIYTNHGHALDLGDELRLLPHALAFRDEFGNLVSIRYDQINFRRTFASAKKPAPKKAHDQPQTEIPWEHPHYRNKIEGFHAIEINTKSLANWSVARAVPKPPDPEPESEEGISEQKSAPPLRHKQKRVNTTPQKSRAQKAAPKTRASARKRSASKADSARTDGGG